MSKLVNMIGLRLTPEEYKAAERIAADESRTLAGVARVALRAYLGERGVLDAERRPKEGERAAA
ncbi:MAG: hypothetical protein KGL39_24075 [Patescibacteria group bacterium]|nr:hypothetical protein [Patescibacteria group bacterium]